MAITVWRHRQIHDHKKKKRKKKKRLNCHVSTEYMGFPKWRNIGWDKLEKDDPLWQAPGEKQLKEENTSSSNWILNTVTDKYIFQTFHSQEDTIKDWHWFLLTRKRRKAQKRKKVNCMPEIDCSMLDILAGYRQVPLVWWQQDQIITLQDNS